MATKSIQKNVTVKSRKQCLELVKAFERAVAHQGQPVVYQKPFLELDDEQIRKFFREKK